MDRLDEAWHFRFITKGHPQPAHGCIETVLEIDERAARPQPATELVPRDDITRPLEQSREDFERLILQRDSDAALAQLSRPHVHLEGAEPESLHTLSIESILS